jgi:Fic family protein
MAYIYQLPGWPDFLWDERQVAGPLANVRLRQGRLIGRMEGLGFGAGEEAVLQTLTEDVLKSSEIEGELLDRAQVRSSVARRLGMEVPGLLPTDHSVEGVVAMMIDATQNHAAPLTAERLCGWQAALFPTGRSGFLAITVGAWRTDASGPMRVVSGPAGHERVHFEAPPAALLEAEMDRFLAWFEGPHAGDPLLKAAIAHLWFVTIHPFDDGNGRIARAIADLALARSEKSGQRFYSLSAHLRRTRDDYYRLLETSQKGDLDITPWLLWFLDCLEQAIAGSEATLAQVMRKARFWQAHPLPALNARQRLMLNRMLDGLEGRMTTSKWARMAKCSADTALRDIADLTRAGLLVKDAARGRSTGYGLVEP